MSAAVVQLKVVPMTVNERDPSYTAQAVNSTFALVVARFAVPLVIAIVGAFGTYALHALDQSINDVKQSNAGLRDLVSQVAASAAQTHEDVKVLSQSVVDQGTAERSDLDSIRATLLDHESRLRALEHHQ